MGRGKRARYRPGVRCGGLESCRSLASRQLSIIGITTVLFSLQTRIIFPGASTQGATVRRSPPAAGYRAREPQDKGRRAHRGPLWRRRPSRRPARPAGRRAAHHDLLLRQRDVLELRGRAARGVPPAGLERAHSRVRRLRNEQRQCRPKAAARRRHWPRTTIWF